MQNRHSNRKGQQDRSGRGKVKGVQDHHTSRQRMGEELVLSERAVANEDYKLDWFKPTETQQEVIYSMHENDCTLVSASSGCGKSTTVIWQGLRDLKRGVFKKILFIKTPNEAGDDPIGYLSGSADEKLTAHFEATKGIFHQFMSEAKLEMEIKRKRIEFKIPNFIQGSTEDNTLFILDESQNCSPSTVKLIAERCGQGSKIVIMGDRRQCYSSKRRDDGFTFFVNLVTETDDEGRYSKIDNIGYVEIPASENMRSDLSRLIVTLFEETDI